MKKMVIIVALLISSNSYSKENSKDQKPNNSWYTRYFAGKVVQKCKLYNKSLKLDSLKQNFDSIPKSIDTITKRGIVKNKKYQAVRCSNFNKKTKVLTCSGDKVMHSQNDIDIKFHFFKTKSECMEKKVTKKEYFVFSLRKLKNQKPIITKRCQKTNKLVRPSNGCKLFESNKIHELYLCKDDHVVTFIDHYFRENDCRKYLKKFQ